MHKLLKFRFILFRLKYVITFLIFAVIIVFFDENNLIKRYRNARMIDEMETEIKQCKDEYKANSSRVYRLQTDPRYLEKIAREKYLMKKPNEDVYVIEEQQ
jgi:cell division protein DivIC